MSRFLSSARSPKSAARFIPDFLVRLDVCTEEPMNLVLETKGCRGLDAQSRMPLPCIAGSLCNHSRAGSSVADRRQDPAGCQAAAHHDRCKVVWTRLPLRCRKGATCAWLGTKDFRQGWACGRVGCFDVECPDPGMNRCGFRRFKPKSFVRANRAGLTGDGSRSEKPNSMARFLFGWLIAALLVAVPAIPAVAGSPANPYIVLCYHDIPEN